MPGVRYVVASLAPVRAGWLRTVSQWAHSSSLPLELVKCMSAEELRARLASNRAFSAALVDAGLPALDRDLIHATRQAGCAMIIVEDRRARRDWCSLGASAVMVGPFEPDDLLQALRRHAREIPDAQVASAVEIEELARGWGAGETRLSATDPAAVVVAVCGSGGVGSSTVAMAVAQGIGGIGGRHGDGGGAARSERMGVSRPPAPYGVLLADMARHADLAVLHDARDVVPGIQELVEAHRSCRLRPEQVAALTFDVAERDYHLLLGLRRAWDWASIGPRSFGAAFDSLRGAYSTVVCDIEADFEGEGEGGSADVEERNVMARTALAHADVVLAVGLPGVKGAYSLVRLLREVAAAGMPPGRVVPVYNRAPRSPRARAELADAVSKLVAPDTATTPRDTGPRDNGGPASPLFLPERGLDEMAGHTSRLPGVIVEPLVAAVSAVVGRSGRRRPQLGEARPVTPGSLGHYPQDDETALG